MNLLVTAATFDEIKPVVEYVTGSAAKPLQLVRAGFYGLNIDFLITGVGLPLTVYNLTRQTGSKKYDLAVNLGLCGSFREAEILTGQTVNITVEQFGDLGVNDNGYFRTLFEIGLADPNEEPFEYGVLKNPYFFPQVEMLTDHSNVKSLTVCTASGDISQIYQRQDKFSAQVENMEGAGFFYVMLREKIPFLEIRAVSNYIEPRNREKWEIMKALEALRQTSVNLLMELATGGFKI